MNDMISDYYSITLATKLQPQGGKDGSGETNQEAVANI